MTEHDIHLLLGCGLAVLYSEVHDKVWQEGTTHIRDLGGLESCTTASGLRTFLSQKLQVYLTGFSSWRSYMLTMLAGTGRLEEQYSHH